MFTSSDSLLQSLRVIALNGHKEDWSLPQSDLILDWSYFTNSVWMGRNWETYQEVMLEVDSYRSLSYLKPIPAKFSSVWIWLEIKKCVYWRLPDCFNDWLAWIRMDWLEYHWAFDQVLSEFPKGLRRSKIILEGLLLNFIKWFRSKNGFKIHRAKIKCYVQAGNSRNKWVTSSFVSQLTDVCLF